MSNLARIEKIDEIKIHKNAESLELAYIGGWQVCVKKGEFEAENLCIFIELDCILDTSLEPFAFLANKQGRIKNIKLRGEFSQGIIFPIEILDHFGHVSCFDKFFPKDSGEPLNIEVGLDLTEYLKVVKYEKPAPNCQSAKGNFPLELVSKTDETNLQNITSVIEEIQDDILDITIKHDGSSITIINLEGEDMRVCSRNLELKDEVGNKFWEAARKYDWPKGFILQGELVGPGIQENREGLKETRIKIFNVYNVEKRCYEPNYIIREIFGCLYGLEIVDQFYYGPCQWKSFAEFMALAETAKYSNGHKAEGIVVRLASPRLFNRIRKDLSFKVVANEYKLKYEN